VLFDMGRRPILSEKSKRKRATRGLMLGSTTSSLLWRSQGSALDAAGYAPAGSEDSDSDGTDDGIAVCKDLPPWVPGTTLAHALQLRRAAARPAMNIDKVTDTLRAATSQGLVQLPPFRVAPRSSSPARAASVQRGDLRNWLESDHGLEWLKAKRARFTES
jgi:hypothetical protein